MALINRDILLGNEKLADMGFKEEAKGRNAIFGGFQDVSRQYPGVKTAGERSASN
jgi:hypothetical protein